MRVALATCAALPGGPEDERLLAAALEGLGADVAFPAWDDPAVGWEGFDLVVVRSTWDYTFKREEFLAWTDRVGDRLRNRPGLIRWNSDKLYLADLAEAGLPTVPTVFAGPGDPEPPLDGELVVKPTVSAGARDTGRFGPATREAARALLARLRGAGRTAMVQPYLESVDSRGEAALVHVAGERSHSLRKRAVLRPDEEAPLRDDALGSAEVMWSEDLVGAAEATAAEEKLARDVVAHLGECFGEPPLYVRVDMVEGPEAEPVVLEVEAVEPALYYRQAPGAAERMAAAIVG